MWKHVPLFICLILTGCNATLVKRAGGSNSPYAPVNEKNLGGMVKYYNHGAAFVIRQRRQSAYKQMYSSCEEDYEITREFSQGYNDDYLYIEYRCVPHKPTPDELATQSATP